MIKNSFYSRYIQQIIYWFKFKQVLSIFILFCLISCSKPDEIEVLPDGTQGTVSDIDGNVYKTKVLFGREWMIENLRVTHLNDGNPIPEVTSNDLWQNASGMAYSWYMNDIYYKDTFGAIYNGFVVESCKICPKEWHVPTNDEWALISEHNVAHWLPIGRDSALFYPLHYTGGRSGDGIFYMGYYAAFYWGSTIEDSVFYLSQFAYHNANRFETIRATNTQGLGIRCIKDR